VTGQEGFVLFTLTLTCFSPRIRVFAGGGLCTVLCEQLLRVLIHSRTQFDKSSEVLLTLLSELDNDGDSLVSPAEFQVCGRVCVAVLCCAVLCCAVLVAAVLKLRTCVLMPSRLFFPSWNRVFRSLHGATKW